MPVKPPQAFRGLTPRVGEPGAHVQSNLREAPGNSPNGEMERDRKLPSSGVTSRPLDPLPLASALLRYLTRERHQAPAKKLPPTHISGISQR